MNKRNIAVLTLAAPFFFMISLWLLRYAQLPLDATLLSSHIKEFGLENSRLQLLFYIGFIGCIAVGCLILLLKPEKFKFLELSLSSLSTPLALVFIVAIFVLGDKAKGLTVGFFFAYLSLLLLDRISKPNLFRQPIAYHLFLSVVMLYFVGFYILPFFIPTFLTSLGRLISIESHYAMTVLPGFDYICCEVTGAVG